MGSRYEAQPYSCGQHGPHKWKALRFSLLIRGDALNPTWGNLCITQVAMESQKDFPFLMSGTESGRHHGDPPLLMH